MSHTYRPVSLRCRTVNEIIWAQQDKKTLHSPVTLQKDSPVRVFNVGGTIHTEIPA